MKKLLVVIIFCLLWSSTVSARSIKDVEFIFRANPTECGNIAKAGDFVLGCHIPRKGKDLIVIRTGMNRALTLMILTHELGHFYLQDVTYEQYKKVYGEGSYHDLNEKAANEFYYFVWFPTVIPKTHYDFFVEMLLASLDKQD